MSCSVPCVCGRAGGRACRARDQGACMCTRACAVLTREQSCGGTIMILAAFPQGSSQTAAQPRARTSCETNLPAHLADMQMLRRPRAPPTSTVWEGAWTFSHVDVQLACARLRSSVICLGDKLRGGTTANKAFSAGGAPLSLSSSLAFSLHLHLSLSVGVPTT